MDHLVVYGLADGLHRQFLDVIQMELERLGVRDLNSIRAMMIYHIGDAEMSVSELVWRGCYQGTNVSYNLKKLIDTGYVIPVRSKFDRRVTLIKAAKKSDYIRQSLQDLSERHLVSLQLGSIGADELALCSKILQGLQAYWARAASLAVIKPEVLAVA